MISLLIPLLILNYNKYLLLSFHAYCKHLKPKHYILPYHSLCFHYTGWRLCWISGSKHCHKVKLMPESKSLRSIYTKKVSSYMILVALIQQFFSRWRQWPFRIWPSGKKTQDFWEGHGAKRFTEVKSIIKPENSHGIEVLDPAIK